jgi:DNA-binding NarL/FixJ family response regulator
MPVSVVESVSEDVKLTVVFQSKQGKLRRIGLLRSKRSETSNAFRPITPPFSLLLVEDDKQACEMVARIVALKFPECTIYTAENGKIGLELFREHTPDLVVTDINMPEMDGIEMAREIKTINPNAAYIVLSARNDKYNVDKFKEIGYCAFLMKPLDFMDLLEAIKHCHPGLRCDPN